jgi:uncharacterized protein
MSEHIHASHPDIVKRLRRADGHLKSVIEMIEAGRLCVDIAQQLHAVEKAIQQAKKTLIHDHLDHCLNDAMSEDGRVDRAAIDGFREITRYL